MLSTRTPPGGSRFGTRHAELTLVCSSLHPRAPATTGCPSRGASAGNRDGTFSVHATLLSQSTALGGPGDVRSCLPQQQRHLRYSNEVARSPTRATKGAHFWLHYLCIVISKLLDTYKISSRVSVFYGHAPLRLSYARSTTHNSYHGDSCAEQIIFIMSLLLRSNTRRCAILSLRHSGNGAGRPPPPLLFAANRSLRESRQRPISVLAGAVDNKNQNQSHRHQHALPSPPPPGLLVPLHSAMRRLWWVQHSAVVTSAAAPRQLQEVQQLASAVATIVADSTATDALLRLRMLLPKSMILIVSRLQFLLGGAGGGSAALRCNSATPTSHVLFSEQRPQENEETAAAAAAAVNASIWLIKRTFQPSIIRKKRKMGFLVRQRTVGGRRTLARRRLKGRARLGGGI